VGVISFIFSARSIDLSRFFIIPIALFLAILSLCSSYNSIANTVPKSHRPSKIMELPPRAYAERQQLSPIRIKGVIQQVTCKNNRCIVEMNIESVKRNKSERPLAKGDIVYIIDIEVKDFKEDSRLPKHQKALIIGLPGNSVRIPPPLSRTEAWLCPAEPSDDRNHTNSYQLMAGPYGFGPSLED